jgi:hypothetical protein
MNVLVQASTWSAAKAMSSQQFADTHYLVVRVAATIAHLAIYLAILVGVRRLVAPRSPKADSATTLATSLAYSCVVAGLMAYLLTSGQLP